MKNPWKTIKKNIVYQNKFGFKLRDDDVITPSGDRGKYMVLEGRDSTAVVAVTVDKKIVMTRQWRYPLEQESLEIPAGGIESGENPETSAKRELKEETGYTSNNWLKLVSCWTAIGIMRCRSNIYLARDCILSAETSNDDTEKIAVETYTYPQIKKLIASNTISDDGSLLGLLMSEKYL